MHFNTHNLVGKRYGRLVVLEATELRNYRRIVWKCLCDCGNECNVSAQFLVRGSTKSCGCLLKDNGAVFYSKSFGATIQHGIKITKEHRHKINTFTIEYKKKNKLKCFVCDSENDIQLHHLYGVNERPDLSMDINNIVELCVNCHKNFHIQYGYGRNTITQFIDFCGGFLIIGDYENA